MGSMVSKILVGVCGAIVFAFVNRLTISLSGLYWWLAFGLVFGVCFLAAVAVGSFRTRTVAQRHEKIIGSRNISDANQTIQVKDLTATQTNDAMVGSANVAKGDQNIKIDKANL